MNSIKIDKLFQQQSLFYDLEILARGAKHAIFKDNLIQ